MVHILPGTVDIEDHYRHLSPPFYSRRRMHTGMPLPRPRILGVLLFGADGLFRPKITGLSHPRSRPRGNALREGDAKEGQPGTHGTRARLPGLRLPRGRISQRRQHREIASWSVFYNFFYCHALRCGGMGGGVVDIGFKTSAFPPGRSFWRCDVSR